MLKRLSKGNCTAIDCYNTDLQPRVPGTHERSVTPPKSIICCASRDRPSSEMLAIRYIRTHSFVQRVQDAPRSSWVNSPTKLAAADVLVEATAQDGGPLGPPVAVDDL